MRFTEFKLVEGTFDPDVKKVQQYLISKGYDLGPTKDDGINGPYTKAAVAKFLAKEQPSANTAVPTNTAPNTSTSSGNILPAKGPITGQYGRTVTGPNGNKVAHPGVDIAAPEGSPIIAPDAGTIKYAGWGNTAGNLVELVTSDGVKHRFMHLSKILVQTGATVKQGQQLGTVGNTGFSKGAHLHWEKYASGKQVNPIAE